jgi:IclR helix-turn-helix domain
MSTNPQRAPDPNAPDSSPEAERAEQAGTRTLARGLAIVNYVAAAGRPVSRTEIADGLRVAPNVISRDLATLTEWRLLEATGRAHQTKRWWLGPRSTEWAQDYAGPIARVAITTMRQLADTFGLTCTLSQARGEQCAALTSAEPTNTDRYVPYPASARHPLDDCAPGRAMLSGSDLRGGGNRYEHELNHGYAVTIHDGQIMWVATAIHRAPQESPVASIGMIGYLADMAGSTTADEASTVDEIAAALETASSDIARRLTEG